MITIKRYKEEDKEQWDFFIKNSKNYLFMFERNYMDYHKDRFTDHSLIFLKDEKIVALLPMNQKGDKLYSHGGLTYGGFISDYRMKQHTMNECFDMLIKYAKESAIKSICYKIIPYIFHKQAAEEDRYALFSRGGRIVTVDASTYANLQDLIKFPKGRKAQISRAKREGVEVSVRDDLDSYIEYMDLENAVLSERHNTCATHTAQEMKMLHDFFPQNIHLYAAQKDGRIIAGTIIYEYEDVVHTQYMAANEEAREIGALDLAISCVIERYKESKKWLDFGISTEHDGVYLNEGLISQKEGFGGRTGTYEIWELEI